MARYPFTDVEQDVIRELGSLGFCYTRETKKTIEFVDPRLDRTIELNRELSGVGLVVGFGDTSKLSGLEGVVKVAPRSSSNFTALTKGVTRNGKDNHQGMQVVVISTDAIPAIVKALA